MRIAIFATLLISYVSSTWAMNPHDDYYSGDIFEAIEEAKKRPHHYDYSRQKRYNRTTTQSIEIPKLMNKEMAGMSIESLENSSAQGAALDSHKENDDDSTLNQLGATGNDGIQQSSNQIQTAPINMNPNVSNQGSLSVISRP